MSIPTVYGAIIARFISLFVADTKLQELTLTVEHMDIVLLTNQDICTKNYNYIYK